MPTDEVVDDASIQMTLVKLVISRSIATKTWATAVALPDPAGPWIDNDDMVLRISDLIDFLMMVEEDVMSAA